MYQIPRINYFKSKIAVFLLPRIFLLLFLAPLFVCSNGKECLLVNLGSYNARADKTNISIFDSTNIKWMTLTFLLLYAFKLAGALAFKLVRMDSQLYLAIKNALHEICLGISATRINFLIISMNSIHQGFQCNDWFQMLQKISSRSCYGKYTRHCLVNSCGDVLFL